MARYVRHDAFYKKAKNERFAARSVYKLEELDERHKLLERGQRVVDFGCSPGSWLQYIAEVVGSTGRVVGYDLVLPSISLPEYVRCFAEDVFALDAPRIRADLWALIHPGQPVPEGLDLRADIVLSDMAPKTSGIRDADQARSIGLVEAALALSGELRAELFVAKAFQGRGFDELVAELRRHYAEVKVLRPKATRQGSREAFVIGRRRRVPA